MNSIFSPSSDHGEGFLVFNFQAMHAQQKFRVQKEKIDLAFQLFISGESIRQTARRVQVAPSTIQRWNDYFYSLA